jgi:hypothetical protein
MDMAIPGLREQFEAEDKDQDGVIDLDAVRRILPRVPNALNPTDILILGYLSENRITYRQLNAYMQAVACGLSTFLSILNNVVCQLRMGQETMA